MTAVVVVPCLDCRHVEVVDADGRRAICRHPTSYGEITDWLKGEVRSFPRSVEHMRTIGECRPEATLFEPASP